MDGVVTMISKYKAIYEKLKVQKPRLQICPLNIFGNKATDGIKPDLNSGFKGLALIQGQIYNPENIRPCYTFWPFFPSKAAFWINLHFRNVVRQAPPHIPYERRLAKCMPLLMASW